MPAGCDWLALRNQSGTAIIDHYIDALRTLGKQPGILGDIYPGAQSRFPNPTSLKSLVTLIDETEWTALGVDVKAEAYEGLLEKAACEGKKGAGQYFTPRVLIQSIVRCLKPDPRAHPQVHHRRPRVRDGRVPGGRLRVVRGRDEGRGQPHIGTEFAGDAGGSIIGGRFHGCRSHRLRPPVRGRSQEAAATVLAHTDRHQ